MKKNVLKLKIGISLVLYGVYGLFDTIITPIITNNYAIAQMDDGNASYVAMMFYTSLVEYGWLAISLIIASLFLPYGIKVVKSILNKIKTI